MRRVTSFAPKADILAAESKEGRPSWDVQVGRFRITPDWAGSLKGGRRMAKPESERGKRAIPELPTRMVGARGLEAEVTSEPGSRLASA